MKLQLAGLSPMDAGFKWGTSGFNKEGEFKRMLFLHGPY